MSDYKRLSNNNLEEYDPEYDFCMGCKYLGEPNGCNRPNGTCANYDRFIETYNRLAELEDKIENGSLVELPCKVGDTFYGIQGEDCFAYRCYGFKYSWPRNEDDECYTLYALTIYEMEFVWGEEAFATKPEAQAKLKKLKEEV